MKLKKNIPHILIFLIFLSVQAGFSQSLRSDQDWLQKGLEAEAKGEYEQALRIWFNSRTALETPSTSIGIEFIRLVTEHKFKNYYKLAHSMYMWGLEGSEIATNKKALERELQRLRPIADPVQWERWNTLLADERPELYDELRNFWNQINYLPDHQYNPRLIEHWERIAYAKEHFFQDENPEGIQDDRTVHYIRFGQPDYLIETDLACKEKEVNDFVVKHLTQHFGLKRELADKKAEEIHNYVTLFEKNTTLSIWAYDAQKLKSNRDLILTFHKKENGSYERINYVGSLIPIAAFKHRLLLMSDRMGYNELYQTGLPGITMQYLYIKKLSEFHSFFAEQSLLLESQLFTPKQETLGEPQFGFSMNFRNNYRQHKVYTSAPNERSKSRAELAEVPIKIYQYRQLSEDLAPVYATFIESRPTEAFFKDYLQNALNNDKDESFQMNDTSLNEKFRLRHIFQMLDESNQPIGQVEHSSAISLLEEELQGTSVFIIPKVKDHEKLVVYSLFENTHLNSGEAHSVNPQELRGLGRNEFEQPDFFEIHPSRLLLSDLIIGYGRNQDLKIDSHFPFTVSNERKIPENENLVIHFEVYNLETDRDGFSQFELKYSFNTRSRFLNLFGGKIPDTEVTLTFKPQNSRFSESIEIQSDFLQVGDYDLNFSITDLTNGNQAERTVEFEVFEGQNSSTASTIE